MITLSPSPRNTGSTTSSRRLAIGFGATVAIWLIVYVTAMPALGLPAWVYVTLSLAALVAAGVVTGRHSSRPAREGLIQGLVIAAINLLLLFSMGSGKNAGEVLHTGLPWVIGFAVAAALLGAVGAVAGRTMPTTAGPVNWTSRLAFVFALATLFLVKAGGAVTGLEAGLVVPDWLTTFGYPMMMYPLSLMQQDGKVFAEHFHRLWGTLVGLITLSAMILIWRTDSRRWLRWLTVAILLMVCAQGIMGALWVLQKITFLRVFHGVFGQVVFATIVSVMAFTSSIWKSDTLPIPRDSAKTDRTLTALLPAVLIVQLILGALYRHLEPKHVHILYTHIMMAAVVLGVLIAAAGRAWGKNSDLPIVPKLGKALLHTVGLQVVLGVVSMIAVWSRDAGDADIPAWEVIVTTAHQVVGAILLALACLLMLWTRRLLAPMTQ